MYVHCNFDAILIKAENNVFNVLQHKKDKNGMYVKIKVNFILV